MSADTSREAALDRLVSQYLKKRKRGPVAPPLAPCVCFTVQCILLDFIAEQLGQSILSAEFASSTFEMHCM